MSLNTPRSNPASDNCSITFAAVGVARTLASVTTRTLPAPTRAASATTRSWLPTPTWMVAGTRNSNGFSPLFAICSPFFCPLRLERVGRMPRMVRPVPKKNGPSEISIIQRAVSIMTTGRNVCCETIHGAGPVTHSPRLHGVWRSPLSLSPLGHLSRTFAAVCSGPRPRNGDPRKPGRDAGENVGASRRDAP